MIYYKIFIILLLLSFLHRDILDKFYDTLKDLLSITLVISGFLIEDFQLFNQIIFFSLITFFIILLIERKSYSRIEQEQKRQYEEEIANANNALILFQQKYDILHEKYSKLNEEHETYLKELHYAAMHLLSTTTGDKGTRNYKECKIVLENIHDLLYTDIKEHSQKIILYDNLKSNLDIQFTILELKRIRNDNLLSDGFNDFLDKQIEYLEVYRRNANCRINNRRFKFK